MTDVQNSETPPAADDKKDEKVNWLSEIKSIALLLLAVLFVHSFIAKPFYIPSESMMPNLLVGDRLVVSKYPYGWSFTAPSFHLMSPREGRLMGKLPVRGDIIILEPSNKREDYIKRVIGLPGDRLEVRQGVVILNGTPVKQERLANMQVPVDANAPCNEDQFAGHRIKKPDGSEVCDLPIIRETLPNGVSYKTIDLGYTSADDYAPVTIPDDHVFVMGDNRDRSADSRFSLDQQGLGGPVPWENIGGRAEFITFSMDGNAKWYNPISWFTAMRSGRAGDSLRVHPTTPEKAATETK